jgi:hypothetical protein
MSEYCQNESCAICLDPLQHRKKTIHTTECGHQFHESCIEKIKKNENGLQCPCCRGHIQPLLKQQIESMKVEIKETKNEIDAFPVAIRSSTKYYDNMIESLSEQLRTMKEAKKSALSEMNNAYKYNKHLLIEQKDQLQKLMVDHELRKLTKQFEKAHYIIQEEVVPEPEIVANEPIPNVIRVPRLRIVERLS